jgi:hypothetical protein
MNILILRRNMLSLTACLPSLFPSAAGVALLCFSFKALSDPANPALPINHCTIGNPHMDTVAAVGAGAGHPGPRTRTLENLEIVGFGRSA